MLAACDREAGVGEAAENGQEEEEEEEEEEGLLPDSPIRLQADEEVSVGDVARLAGSGRYDSRLCDSGLAKYEKIVRIGQGTFGDVYKARHRRRKHLVAMKRIKTRDEADGFPITAVREISILQAARHRHIVRLLEVCKAELRDSPGRLEFYLVFEIVEHDLAGLLADRSLSLALAERKSLIKQLLEAVWFLHSNNILHRDIKAANILVSRTGVLKLADFGLARRLSTSSRRYTDQVVTLWYRAPELLLGSLQYGPPLDMWSVGCIAAELWTRDPIMQGDNEMKQLTLIVNLCGSITPQAWPDVEKLELYGKMRDSLPASRRRRVRELLKQHIPDSELALDIIDRLLSLDPSQRLTANEAVNHDFLHSEPLPASLESKLRRMEDGRYQLLIPKAKRPPGAVGRQPPAPTRQFPDNPNYDRIF